MIRYCWLFNSNDLSQKLGAPHVRAEELAPVANVHMRSYHILDNHLHLAHFIAQLAHDSSSFRYIEEITNGAAY